jgi:hypothetical protein
MGPPTYVLIPVHSLRLVSTYLTRKLTVVCLFKRGPYM